MEQYTRDKLVADNQRLVYYLYEKLAKNPFVIQYKDDLVSEGMVGLVKAANKFDPTRGTRFCTYASRCIENEMLMFIRRMGKQVCREVSLYEPVGQDDEGREITYADVLADDGINPEDCVFAVAVDNFMSKQKEIDREIVDALRQGYKQSEVAEMFGLRQPTVSRRVRRLKAKFKNENPM